MAIAVLNTKRAIKHVIFIYTRVWAVVKITFQIIMNHCIEYGTKSIRVSNEAKVNDVRIMSSIL